MSDSNINRNENRIFDKFRTENRLNTITSTAERVTAKEVKREKTKKILRSIAMDSNNVA